MEVINSKRAASPCHLDISEKKICLEDRLVESYENPNNVLYNLLTNYLDSRLESNTGSDINDDDDDTSQRLSDSSNDYDRSGTDTPITPVTPSRKKFPSQLKTIRCTYNDCSKTFNRPAKLAAHLRSHTNERPYICSHEGCSKAYLQNKHLQHHIKSSHTNERNFRCEWKGCGKVFLTSTRLKRHNKIHEGDEKFRCTDYPPCSQTFRKHQTLQRHIRSEHLQLLPFLCTFIDPITSKECNSGFESSAKLRQHQVRAHGCARYFCSQCTMTGSFNLDGTPIHPGFTSYYKLQAHIRKEHAYCIFCDIKFHSHRELVSHVDSAHSGKSLEERQRFCCNEPGCNKRFTSRFNLNTHIDTAHLGKRFICGTFDLDTQLEGYNWNNSMGCGNFFNSKKNLLNHILNVHLKAPICKGSISKAQKLQNNQLADSKTDTVYSKTTNMLSNH